MSWRPAEAHASSYLVRQPAAHLGLIEAAKRVEPEVAS